MRQGEFDLDTTPRKSVLRISARGRLILMHPMATRILRKHNHAWGERESRTGSTTPIHATRRRTMALLVMK